MKEEVLLQRVQELIKQNYVDAEDDVIGIFIKLSNLIETQKAIINLMAEQLTTPIKGKEWVIEYYTKLAEEEK